MDMKSQRIVEELFAIFMHDWKLLPMDVRKQLNSRSKDIEIAETICEYIANMTDMHAIEEHKKLYDPHTRF
jgi:dGTPase